MGQFRYRETFICAIDVKSHPVATERKPSTGLKHVLGESEELTDVVATERKPSTGLKLSEVAIPSGRRDGRDGEKTQHGIETG